MSSRRIEKFLGDEKYILDTDDSSLTYSSHDGEIFLRLDADPIDFDLGQYGDGCGGGRVFILFKNYIKVYNPEAKTFVMLLQDLKKASSIFKKGCELFIKEEDGDYVFNLSKMSKEKNENSCISS